MYTLRPVIVANGKCIEILIAYQVSSGLASWLRTTSAPEEAREMQVHALCVCQDACRCMQAKESAHGACGGCGSGINLISKLLEQVEQLIISELEKLAKEGFSKASIEAAVNSIEFDLRENNTGRFPRGLSLMLRSMSAWIYDRDPLSRLRWTEPLEHFKVCCGLQTAVHTMIIISNVAFPRFDVMSFYCHSLGH